MTLQYFKAVIQTRVQCYIQIQTPLIIPPPPLFSTICHLPQAVVVVALIDMVTWQPLTYGGVVSVHGDGFVVVLTMGLGHHR